jgi:hypothetical protein
MARLLGGMRSVRYYAILCGAAAGYNSPRYGKTDALRKAIDTLAEDLTGDGQFYWDKVAVAESQAKNRA